MLRDFITTNRDELIGRCRTKVAKRRAPRPTASELEHDIPVFIDQVARMLSGACAEPDGSVAAASKGSLTDEARSHGRELMQANFPIAQVVNDYGELRQTIIELAHACGTPIAPEEFGTLNKKLDMAIAAAVSEYARGREAALARSNAEAVNERLGMLGHEMRNFLNTAILALAAMKSGSVGFGGQTAAALDRSLLAMRDLVDRTLTTVRMGVPPPAALSSIQISAFFAEIQVAAALEATTRGCELTVEPVPAGLRVTGDRPILASVLANLLQNAFKFTRPHGHVVLRCQAVDGRVRIEVEDECGGLAEGSVEGLFRPFEQRGKDRSGLGLGLAICRRGVEQNGGTLSARSLPGKGCIFTIELAQAAGPPREVEEDPR